MPLCDALCVFSLHSCICIVASHLGALDEEHVDVTLEPKTVSWRVDHEDGTNSLSVFRVNTN